MAVYPVLTNEQQQIEIEQLRKEIADLSKVVKTQGHQIEGLQNGMHALVSYGRGGEI